MLGVYDTPVCHSHAGSAHGAQQKAALQQAFYIGRPGVQVREGLMNMARAADIVVMVQLGIEVNNYNHFTSLG